MIADIREVAGNPEMSISSIFRQAIAAGENIRAEEWREMIGKVMSYSTRRDIPTPATSQVRINDDELMWLNKIKKDIRAAATGRIQEQFCVQLLFYNYREYLERKPLQAVCHSAEELSGPDLVKAVVELLLLKRQEELRQIAEIITKWRNSQ